MLQQPYFSTLIKKIDNSLKRRCYHKDENFVSDRKWIWKLSLQTVKNIHFRFSGGVLARQYLNIKRHPGLYVCFICLWHVIYDTDDKIYIYIYILSSYIKLYHTNTQCPTCSIEEILYVDQAPCFETRSTICREPVYYHGLTQMYAWISNYIHCFLWHVVTHPCAYFNSSWS